MAGSLSTRIAVALNSAVPDLGSQASSVSTLVATWSGKCSVMKASPARSTSSMWTGTSSDPRRDDTFATSSSARPSRPASSGERLSVSGRRNGVVYFPVCTPVLNESSRRPVVSRIGNSGDSSSTGGSCSTGVNGAGVPRLAGSSSHSRACRNRVPGCCSSGHGHWMPPSSSSRW